ncbi:uncharacterized protein LOC144220815 [Crocuta crocuta]
MLPFITRVHRPQCLCLSARLSYQMISAQCGPSFLGGEDSNLGSRALEDVKTLCWNPSPGSLPEAHLRQRKFSCCLQIEADRELSKTGGSYERPPGEAVPSCPAAWSSGSDTAEF